MSRSSHTLERAAVALTVEETLARGEEQAASFLRFGSILLVDLAVSRKHNHTRKITSARLNTRAEPNSNTQPVTRFFLNMQTTNKAISQNS